MRTNQDGQSHVLGMRWGTCEDDIDICGDCARKLRIYVPDTPYPYGGRICHNLIVSLLRERASARKREGQQR